MRLPSFKLPPPKYIIPLIFIAICIDFYRLSPQMFLTKVTIVTILTVAILGCQDFIRFIQIKIDDYKKGYDWREEFRKANQKGS